MSLRASRHASGRVPPSQGGLFGLRRAGPALGAFLALCLLVSCCGVPTPGAQVTGETAGSLPVRLPTQTKPEPPPARQAAPTCTSTAALTPTATHVPTPTANPAPQTVPPGLYDLYVRRMQFGPYAPGEEPRAGDPVPLIVMIATDKHHGASPYFPASHLRWRQGATFPWQERDCPADYHYASRMATAQFTYNAPGIYDVSVEADSQGEVDEVDEGNNHRTWRLYVAPANPPNLLANPAADLGLSAWTSYGDAGTERDANGADDHFAARNGGFLWQEVTLDEADGKTLLLIGCLSSEQTMPGGDSTGLPYLLGTLQGVEGEILHSLHGQQMLYSADRPNAWVAAWGSFPVTPSTATVSVYLKQAEQQGVPLGGPTALFDVLGLYVLESSAEVPAMVETQSTMCRILNTPVP